MVVPLLVPVVLGAWLLGAVILLGVESLLGLADSLEPTGRLTGELLPQGWRKRRPEYTQRQ